METHTRPAWDDLSEDHRKVWIQNIINFYPPNTVTPQEAVALARDEYNDAEMLLPEQVICEAD